MENKMSQQNFLTERFHFHKRTSKYAKYPPLPAYRTMKIFSTLVKITTIHEGFDL